MNQLFDHKADGLNDALEIVVCDEPGAGGACHHYRVVSPLQPVAQDILFQKGPVQEAGINGISNEALLAVVLDRLRGFQSGEFRCRENACAITHIEEGLMWLQKRTLDRTRRGVEGTSAK